MSAPSIACLKIVLQDVEPTVLRSVEVPLSMRLDRLHLLIQAAMGWSNSHLYEIHAGNLGWGIVDEDDYASRLDAHEACLSELLGYSNEFTYLYDFGDGWYHATTVERIIDPVAGTRYPRLVEAIGRCPPEDVGGPRRYLEFQKAIRNPSHELHAQFNEWIGADFDPNAVNFERLAKAVEELDKR
jgi:hypothetical protein